MKCKLNICHACCCYNIPFEHHELERFADKIVNPVITIDYTLHAQIAITDFDWQKNKCPFLTQDYKCNIYEQRPEVCRKFGEIKELTCKFRR